MTPSDRMFNKTCTFSAPNNSQATSGAIKQEDYSTGSQYVGVPCAMHIRSSSDPVENYREQDKQFAMIFIRATSASGVAYSVDVNWRATIDGVTWRVSGVSTDASAGRGACLRIPVERPV